MNAVAGKAVLKKMLTGAVKPDTDIDTLIDLHSKAVLQVYPANSQASAHAHGAGLVSPAPATHDFVVIMRGSFGISGNAVRAGSRGPVFGVSSDVLTVLVMDSKGQGTQLFGPNADMRSKAQHRMVHSAIAPPADGMYTSSSHSSGSVGKGLTASITIWFRSDCMLPEALSIIADNCANTVFADADIQQELSSAFLKMAHVTSPTALHQPLAPGSTDLMAALTYRSSLKNNPATDLSTRQIMAGGGDMQYDAPVLMALQDGSESYRIETIKQRREFFAKKRADKCFHAGLGKTPMSFDFFDELLQGLGVPVAEPGNPIEHEYLNPVAPTTIDEVVQEFGVERVQQQQQQQGGGDEL